MSGATKYDNGKLPMDLLDPEWLEGVAAILQFGAKKYAAHNWRKGMQWSRLYAAIQRHLNSFAKGEETDPETGLSHLLHASCGLMFLYTMQQQRRELNDLYWAAGVEPSETPRPFENINGTLHAVLEGLQTTSAVRTSTEGGRVVSGHSLKAPLTGVIHTKTGIGGHD